MQAPEAASKISDLETRVQAVFRKIFKNNQLELKREWTAFDIPGWDSMNHVLLMVSLQKEFGIKFQTVEIVRIKNIGELIDTVRMKTTAT